MKRKSIEWEKIFSNDVTDKGLISKIGKQLIQFINNNNKNPKQPNQKMDRKSKQTFLQRTQITKKYSAMCSVMSDSLRPHGLQPTRLLCPWNFPGKNTGVGCHFYFQVIFLTQGSNPNLQRLLHCEWVLYPLSHQGSPRIAKRHTKRCSTLLIK